MKFEELDIAKVGHEIQIAGVVFNHDKENRCYLLILPNEDILGYFNPISMTVDDWKEFLFQTDTLQTEVITKEGNELVKAVFRKANRQIDNHISWKVFKRDDYKCRYCGKDDVPLTVDHIVLWEEGGPSIERNLVSACKKCNRKRGNMQYEEWLNSDLYGKVSKNLDAFYRQLNWEVLNDIPNIPKSFVKMRGKKR